MPSTDQVDYESFQSKKVRISPVVLIPTGEWDNRVNWIHTAKGALEKLADENKNLEQQIFDMRIEIFGLRTTHQGLQSEHTQLAEQFEVKSKEYRRLQECLVEAEAERENADNEPEPEYEPAE